ncbi:MAG: hypothetical protein K4H23_04850 [Mollicutes bacterium PWAP]|nr:hypothetical protein [Mollicutes bacterium PWAP]
MFDWLLHFTIEQRALIIGAIIFGFLIIVLLIAYFAKPKIKRKNFVYFYAFSCGFLLMVALLGLLSSVKNNLHFSPSALTVSSKKLHNGTFVTEIDNKVGYIITVILFVSLTSATCIFIARLVNKISNFNFYYKDKRYVNLINQDYENVIKIALDHNVKIDKYKNKKSLAKATYLLINKQKNSHEFLVKQNKRKKINGIVLMLTHRIPASILIGAFLLSPVAEESALLSILAHLIPEILIVFYRQIEAGIKKRKALLSSILIKLLFIPMILVGSIVASKIKTLSLWWFKPLIYILGGTLLLYAAVNEFGTDFMYSMNHQTSDIHYDKDNKKILSLKKEKEKVILFTVIFFGLGIALSSGILSFHFH